MLFRSCHLGMTHLFSLVKRSIITSDPFTPEMNVTGRENAIRFAVRSRQLVSFLLFLAQNGWLEDVVVRWQCGLWLRGTRDEGTGDTNEDNNGPSSQCHGTPSTHLSYFSHYHAPDHTLLGGTLDHARGINLERSGEGSRRSSHASQGSPNRRKSPIACGVMLSRQFVELRFFRRSDAERFSSQFTSDRISIDQVIGIEIVIGNLRALPSLCEVMGVQ